MFKPSAKLALGTILYVNQNSLVPSATPISILAQNTSTFTDIQWILVNKPALIHTHPKQPGEISTILNSVYNLYPEILGVGSSNPLVSGIVHRLDYETSGVTLIALTQKAFDIFRMAFDKRLMKKKYYAIVYGFPKQELSLTIPLVVQRHSPSYVGIDPKVSFLILSEGYPAIMNYKVLNRFTSSSCSFIEVNLETGFLHQIRVSMNHLGHPVLGDKVYNSKESQEISLKFGIERQLLHAHRISFLDENVNIDTESPLPNDFKEVIMRLENNIS